jgi:hypothetical protein
LNNADARRLLTEINASLVVEIFVNDSTANTTLLTDAVVNDNFAQQPATAGLSVRLDTFERRTSPVYVTTPPPVQPPPPPPTPPTPGLPPWALIVIILGAVTFLSGGLIFIYWVTGRGTKVVVENSRMVATYHGPQRELVYQTVSYPNANASPARNLDTSHFFEFSKRLHSPDSVYAN